MTPQQIHLARALAAALLAAGLGACGTLGRAQQERVQYTDEPVERIAGRVGCGLCQSACSQHQHDGQWGENSKANTGKRTRKHGSS